MAISGKFLSGAKNLGDYAKNRGIEAFNDKVQEILTDGVGNVLGLLTPTTSIDIASIIKQIQNQQSNLAKTLNVQGYTPIPNGDKDFGNPDKWFPALMKRLPELRPYEKTGLEFAEKFKQGLDKWEKLSEE